jgi:hypothetical protein
MAHFLWGRQAKKTRHLSVLILQTRSSTSVSLQFTKDLMTEVFITYLVQRIKK